MGSKQQRYWINLDTLNLGKEVSQGQSPSPQQVALVPTKTGTWAAWRGGQAFIPKEVRTLGQGVAEHSVVAPLTAKVVSVSTEAGAQVEEGDTLLVLEAMKMEYKLTSPKAGTIANIVAKEGELVDKGAVLVSFEEET